MSYNYLFWQSCYFVHQYMIVGVSKDQYTSQPISCIEHFINIKEFLYKSQGKAQTYKLQNTNIINSYDVV